MLDPFLGDLRDILSHDAGRMRCLRAVRDLRLNDGWIAAGFLRDAVWDHLHGIPIRAPINDIDVTWYGPMVAGDRGRDRRFESALTLLCPNHIWSVKNQARMHLRNHDAPYLSTFDAMRFWPDTSTTVAVRLTPTDVLDFTAVYGWHDLFDLILRPTPHFARVKPQAFHDRVTRKLWLRQWPKLSLSEQDPCIGPARGGVDCDQL